MVTAVGEDIIFVTGRRELLLGSRSYKQIAGYVLFGARHIGLIGYGAVCRSLQNKSRLFGDYLACTECLRMRSAWHAMLTAGRNARDDICRTAGGNLEVLVLQVIGSVAGGADDNFFAVFAFIIVPMVNSFIFVDCRCVNGDIESRYRVEE